MGREVNYTEIFDKYFCSIKSARDPSPERPETMDLEWKNVLKEELFNFGGNGFKKNSETIKFARKISIACLNEIIYHLQGKKNLFQALNITTIIEKVPRLCFVLQHIETKELLIFKEVEECNFWKVKDQEPEIIQQFMNNHAAQSCKYVYLMHDKAYLQVIGHSDDINDPGRGYNLYSIRWFFEYYYGKEEYRKFASALDVYTQKVNDYLGFITLHSLTPNASVNFRKITEQRLLAFDYSELLTRKEKNLELDEDAFSKINEQFISQKKYLLAVGESDFAESLITAEWLFDSMRAAKAIDLTIIAMGYFKAIEQLMCRLIEIHNAQEDVAQMAIGAMATFYRDNVDSTDVFRYDLRIRSRKYVKEAVYSYKDLRNGYLHKHNIHDFKVVEEIRGATFRLVFLLLGSHTLSKDDLEIMGMPNEALFSDYAKLCEYVDYHSGELLFIETGDECQELVFVACRDREAEVVGQYVKHSGMYMKPLGKEKPIYLVKEENLPKVIYQGKLKIEQSEEVHFTPVKVRKIYENGKFVGPLIASEEDYTY